MRNLILILFILFAGSCFAADNGQQNNTSDDQPASTYHECASYEDCLQNGLQERANNVNSKLFYFNTNDKDIKYNLFQDIMVKISANICPPLITVYKKVNNVNYMLDLFTRRSGSECTMYYSNITGAGKNRDSIVGQLEIFFCNKDELDETCDQALLYARENMFHKAEKQQQPVQSVNSDSNAALTPRPADTGNANPLQQMPVLQNQNGVNMQNQNGVNMQNQ